MVNYAELGRILAVFLDQGAVLAVTELLLPGFESRGRPRLLPGGQIDVYARGKRRRTVAGGGRPGLERDLPVHRIDPVPVLEARLRRRILI